MKGFAKTALVVLVLLAAQGCSVSSPNVRLFLWERGVGVESMHDPAMKMYLWFYEWHMFDAVAAGQHTHGDYRSFAKHISDDSMLASLCSDIITLKARAVRDGADLILTITNRSDHDWPEIAAIIPCFNPGPEGERNPQFANTNTFFVSEAGLHQQDKREIHFNRALKSLVEDEATDAPYAWSEKWPLSEVDAAEGLLIRESTDGRWATGIVWEDFLSAQGHNPWQCMHLSVRVGAMKRGETRQIGGRIYLMPGDKEDLYRRYRSDFGKSL